MKNLFILIALLVFVVTGCTSATIGALVRIQAPGNDPFILLAIDEATYDTLGKSLMAKDWVGIQQLLRTRRVIEIFNGTNALIIDIGDGKRKIRIQEGNYSGRTGWINQEYLQVMP